MPVQSDLFHHFIVTAAVVNTCYRIVEYEKVKKDACEYVESMKACNEEEEIGKRRWPILINMKVGTCYCHIIPDTRLVSKLS